MKYGITLATLALFSSLVWSQPSDNDVVEETLYQHFKANLTSQNKTVRPGITPLEQKLFVDAAWDLADEGIVSALNVLTEPNTIHFGLAERLRIGILNLRHKKTKALPVNLTLELRSHLQLPAPETKVVYLIAAYEADLLKSGNFTLVELAKKHDAYRDIKADEDKMNAVTDEMITDIFQRNPDVSTYMNGEYVKSVKLFNFCRSNRLYPCLMVMKDIHGQVVRNLDGSIWTHKALASSKHGLPSYTKNGNTPAGIFTIDSVMPVADQQSSYGKFRRMILNFVPKSKNEVLMKSLLPTSSHDQEWWKASTTARDIGRNLFRIHGTLQINKDPAVPYYPFVRTSGCIAQRENTYDGVTFKDQRELLDTIMRAMDLAPTYANEVLVKGILYVVELDDQDASVEVEDLALRGIL